MMEHLLRELFETVDMKTVGEANEDFKYTETSRTDNGETRCWMFRLPSETRAVFRSKEDKRGSI